MKVFIIHNEGDYFSGAERLLEYYSFGLRNAPDIHPGLAHAPTGAMNRLASGFPVSFLIAAGGKMTPLKLIREVLRIWRFGRVWRPDIVHGWSARDWETAGFAGWLLKVPVVGGLFDHPLAGFITPRRQQMMNFSSRWLMSRVICASEAVRHECLCAEYRPERLRVLRAGISPVRKSERKTGTTARLGFLGALSRRKGIDLLFVLIDLLAESLIGREWSLTLAGDAAGESDREWLKKIRARYSCRAWWSRVTFIGWIEDIHGFLDCLDVLIVPSVEFDPYPTVLLEAAWAGVPVFATKVGGIPEIVVPGETGELFDPADVAAAAALLSGLLTRHNLAAMSIAARTRAELHFGVDKMVAGYKSIYSEVVDHA